MKKLIIVGVFVFAFALTANVAFGFTMQNNYAVGVTNGISSLASNSGNYITQGCLGGSAIIANGAVKSSASGIAALNTNVAVNDGAMQGNMAAASINVIDSQAGISSNSINQPAFGGTAAIVNAGVSSRARGISLLNTNVSVGCPCQNGPSHPSCCHPN